MPATVKATLKTDARQDKTHAVRIRITTDRKPVYHNTGIYVLKSHWNPKATLEKRNWIKGHYNHDAYNKAINDLLAEFTELALKHPFEDAAEIIRLYKKPPPETVDFLQFFRRELDRIKATGNPRTYVRRLPLYNKLYEFAGGKVVLGKRGTPTVYGGNASLPIEKVTVSFIRNFVTWLQTKQGNSGETIKKEMQVLSGLCKIAVHEGLMDYAANPMPHISVKSKPKRKDRLTPEQLRTFEDFELPAARASLGYARDCFLLQYYLHGARVTDAIELRQVNITDTRVTYVMRKTGTIKSIKRSPGLNKVLERYPPRPGSPYVLPFLKAKDEVLPLPQYLKRLESVTAFINRLLKEIAALLQWDIHITTHVARHTLADIARKKIGMHLLQDMLGHKTLKTTEGYVSTLDLNEMDEADSEVYG